MRYKFILSNTAYKVMRASDAFAPQIYRGAASIVLTVKMPDGSVLESKQVDINGSTYTTAPDGSVVLTGEYGGKIVCRCVAGETLDATVEVIFDGRSYSVTLQRKYKVTISRYEKRYQVLTTICRGLAYQNEQVLYVQYGAEVTVTASGMWDHPGDIIVNGKNSKRSTLTITIKEDTTITTTEPYDYPSCSDSGCGGEGG